MLNQRLYVLTESWEQVWANLNRLMRRVKNPYPNLFGRYTYVTTVGYFNLNKLYLYLSLSFNEKGEIKPFISKLQHKMKCHFETYILKLCKPKVLWMVT